MNDPLETVGSRLHVHLASRKASDVHASVAVVGMSRVRLDQGSGRPGLHAWKERCRGERACRTKGRRLLYRGIRGAAISSGFLDVIDRGNKSWSWSRNWSRCSIGE